MHRRADIYDSDRLLYWLPVSDDLLMWRFAQAEDKMAWRSWIQSAETVEERNLRVNVLWLRYFHGQSDGWQAQLVRTARLFYDICNVISRR
jgi:hypothetical protein